MPKYKFEQKFVDKQVRKTKQSEGIEIATTVVDEQVVDYFAKYSDYMDNYNREMQELELKSSQIPKKDVITYADEERAIEEHFEQETLLE